MSETATPIPKLSHYKPLKDLRTHDEAFEHPEVLRRFQQALGQRFDAYQYMATLRGLVKENEKIAQADMWEFIRCALDLAELGLRPNTPFGHAWIIPRLANRKINGQWKEVMTLAPQVGYQGFLELAYRADTLSSIHADVVFEGDEFDYEYGSRRFLRHKPKGSQRGRKPLQAYAHANLKGGGEEFIVWDWADVEYIRDGSDGYRYAISQSTESKAYKSCPWIAYPVPMGKKTMIIQVLKVLPRSSEFLVRATQLDGEADAGKISYFGAAGEFSARPELTYQPTVPFTSFRAPVVDSMAVNANQEAQRAASSAQNAQSHDAAPSKEQPKSQATQQSKSTVERTAFRPILYSPDGTKLAECRDVYDWAKEYVATLFEVPGADLEAYRAINADMLESCEQDADALAVLQEASEASRAPAQTAEQIDLRVNLGSELRDDQVVTTYASAIMAITSVDVLEEWHRVNKDGVQSFKAAVKMPILKALAARRRELSGA